MCVSYGVESVKPMLQFAAVWRPLYFVSYHKHLRPHRHPTNQQGCFEEDRPRTNKKGMYPRNIIVGGGVEDVVDVCCWQMCSWVRRGQK